MEALLKKIQLRLQGQETSPQLECWLQDAVLAEELDGHLTLICPNVFSKQWLQGKYKGSLEWAIREETGKEVALNFRVLEHPSGVQCSNNDLTSPPRTTTQETSSTTGAITTDEVVQKEKQETANSASSPSRKTRYSLSGFVVGPCNRFAWSAVHEVCKQIDNHYNPLLLLASTGLGKTHLGLAIQDRLRKQDSCQRVLYGTAEGYFSEMIQHMKNQSIFSFKHKYRKDCDTLILDDIQFVLGKKALQSDLCHTLDTLLHHEKRVVLLGNLPSDDIDKLHENFRSRIFSGLVISMERPDYETRIAMLRQFARSAKVSLPEETFEVLARVVPSHVRDLEGAFHRAIALQTFLSQPLDPQTLEMHLRDLPGSHFGSLTLERIATHVARYYELPSEALASRSRHKKVLYPRQVAMYLSRKHTHESLEAIGKQYNRDHSSVLYAIKSLETKTARSPLLLRELRFLEERLLEKHG